MASDAAPGHTPDFELQTFLDALADGNAALDVGGTKDLICSGEWLARFLRATTSPNAFGLDPLHRHPDRFGPPRDWAGRAVGDVRINFAFEGDINVTNGGSVSGTLRVEGRDSKLGAIRVEGDGSIVGGIAVEGAGSVTRTINVGASGSIAGRIDILGGGSFVGGINVVGAAHSLSLEGASVAHIVSLRPESAMKVTSLNRTSLNDRMILGQGVSLEACDLRNFDDYDKLHVIGAGVFDPLGPKPPVQWLTRLRRSSLRQAHELSRQRIGHEISGELIPEPELAAIYRSLRVKLEKGGDRPGASDFYHREMDARAKTARSKGGLAGLAEWLVLSTYRSVSEYGTRAWRPLCWFAGTAVFCTFLFVAAGFDLAETQHVTFSADGDFLGGQVLLFTVESMVSFFRQPTAGNLSAWEETWQLVLRFVGPTLVAQFVLSLRERVAR